MSLESGTQGSFIEHFSGSKWSKGGIETEAKHRSWGWEKESVRVGNEVELCMFTYDFQFTVILTVCAEMIGWIIPKQEVSTDINSQGRGWSLAACGSCEGFKKLLARSRNTRTAYRLLWILRNHVPSVLISWILWPVRSWHKPGRTSWKALKRPGVVTSWSMMKSVSLARWADLDSAEELQNQHRKLKFEKLCWPLQEVYDLKEQLKDAEACQMAVGLDEWWVV